MVYISTDFGAASSSRFPFKARTNRQTDRQTDWRDWMPYPTPAAIQPAWVKSDVLTRNEQKKMNETKYGMARPMPHVLVPPLLECGSHGFPSMHANMICCQLSPVAHLSQNPKHLHHKTAAISRQCRTDRTHSRPRQSVATTIGRYVSEPAKFQRLISTVVVVVVVNNQNSSIFSHFSLI